MAKTRRSGTKKAGGKAARGRAARPKAPRAAAAAGTALFDVTVEGFDALRARVKGASKDDSKLVPIAEGLDRLAEDYRRLLKR